MKEGYQSSMNFDLYFVGLANIQLISFFLERVVILKDFLVFLTLKRVHLMVILVFFLIFIFLNIRNIKNTILKLL